MSTRRQLDLPYDAAIELTTIETLARTIIRRLDELARRADWLQVTLFEIYRRGNAKPPDDIKQRIAEINNKIYELDGYYPFSPLCDLFPAETPSPTPEEQEANARAARPTSNN
jgi:hypothetical protein